MGPVLIVRLSILLALLIPAAQSQSRLLSAITNDQTVVINDNTPRVITSGIAIDQGTAPRNQSLPRLVLHFTMTAAQRADLTQFLESLQDRRSPQYHKFLTPEQYADRFGLQPADIEKISRWLENSGFHSLQVARSRSWISFSGTAAQAESAFHTSIHRYSVRGEEHWANATDPHVPKAMQGLVDSVRGLHNIPLRPSLVHLHPSYTSSLSGNHYLAPDDWATIYDVQPLYSSGLDGTGVSIAIVGQSDVNLANIQTFRSLAGLSVNAPTVIKPDIDPGYQSASGDETESYLDLEWAGAIAKNASILFVTSGNGVEDAMTYAIDNNIAPIVSQSYGLCEPQETTSDFNVQTSLFMQANTQGMTIIASSGDSGATACDQGVTEFYATLGLAVNFPASSPYVTGIGGTAFNAIGSYWNSSNNASGGSAISYIPEVVWNDGFQLASGGGASTLVTTKPVWQTGSGVPNDGVRDVPDLAFAASPELDGYLICESGTCTNGFRDSSNNLDVIGGTSAGAPSFAGLLALVIQQKGTTTRLGNINPNLYSLAQISTDAFHDITSGNNEQLCAPGTPNCPTGTSKIGYSAGVGYDQTTGLGSLDGYNFAQEWYGDFQISASTTSVTIQPGASATTTMSVVPQNNFSGNVTFSCAVSANLVGVTCSVPSTPVGPSGSAVVTINASSAARTPPTVRRWPILLLAGLILSLLLPAITRSHSPFRIRPLYAASAASLLVIALGAVSCGGGGSTSVTYGGGTTTTTTTTTQTTPALTISCTEPATATIGVAYTGACTASGGTAPYTYATPLAALPTGLALDIATGVIAGIPTSYGTSSFAVTATDSSLPHQTVTSATQTLSVSSAPAAPLTISCSLPPATLGNPYGSTGSCMVSGGTPFYNFTIIAGALPQGLSLINGGLSGVPTTAGTSSFTLQVTDSGPRLGLPQQTATFVVSNFVVLIGPLAVSCAAPIFAIPVPPEVMMPFSQTCYVSGGIRPYSFSVISGALPPGLTLNAATGVISGIPTTAGSYTATLRASDSESPAQIATQSFSVDVLAYVPLSCGLPLPPTSAQLEVPFTGVFCPGAGGTAPYTRSLTGNLPPGLAFNQGSATIQGTPTQAGTYSFTVSLTDSASPPATVTYPVTNFVVGPHGPETGTVTITATSGGIVNTTTINVTVP